MTIKRYLETAVLTGDVIVARVSAGSQPSIRLAETYFHVQGGGQRADRGTIGGVLVKDVRQAEDGGVDHYMVDVEAFESGESYTFAIDAEWRIQNSNLHSAGHLLAAVCEAMFPGTRALGGHHWPGEARVDFAPPSDDPDMQSRMLKSGEEIEARVRAEVSSGLSIRIVGDPFNNRACQIGLYPLMPCGGTHAETTADIGAFRLRSVKAKGAMIRIGYELS